MKKRLRRNLRYLARLKFPRTPAGAPPGTLEVDPEAPPPLIHVIAYDTDEAEERDIDRVEEIRGLLGRRRVTWVDVTGLGSVSTMEELGRVFNIHPLALEDVLNAYQRPKVDHYPDNLYVVARMPHMDEAFSSEQVSMFVGSNYVLTVQERPGDSFGPVRNRIMSGRARIRSMGPDYLAYALLDAVVDGYFPLLEDYGEMLEELENEIFENPRPSTVAAIQDARKDMISMRRSVWPLRDVLSELVREESPHFSSETKLFLRDTMDHTIRIMDLLETYREVGSSLMEFYNSAIGNRMNEVMKVLTVIATIFIPLSFIAGVYGMNFDPAVSEWNMPELAWSLGYPFVLGLMLTVAVVLLIYFRRKGWVGGDDDHRPGSGGS